MAEFDTAQLVESIRTRGQIPNAGDWTDQKILDVATEELRSAIVPQVLSVREGYYDEEIDIAFKSTYPKIRLPFWAIGQKLGGAYYVPVGQQPVPLDQLNEKQIYGMALTDTRPVGYILRGNFIIPYPAPSASATGSIRLKCQARPSALVLPSVCSVGSADGHDLNYDYAFINNLGVTDPSFTTKFPNDSKVDLVATTPGFETVVRLGYSDLVSFPGQSTVFVDPFDSFGSLRDGFDVATHSPDLTGLTVTPHGQTCFPQCPTEFWYILAQTVAVKYLENQGFVDELTLARQELDRLRHQVMPTITPRGGEDTKRIRNVSFFPRG